MGENVLICLCGSVNSINISHYIIELKSKFDEVNVIASTNGRKFINGEILKQFCDNYYDEFEDPFLNHVDIAINMTRLLFYLRLLIRLIKLQMVYVTIYY